MGNNVINPGISKEEQESSMKVPFLKKWDQYFVNILETDTNEYDILEANLQMDGEEDNKRVVY